MVNISLDTAFFRSISISAVDMLIEYGDTIESHLWSIASDDRHRIDDTLGTQQWRSEDAYAEWSIALDEHSAKYEMLLTNYSRFAYVLLTCLVFEEWFKRLCYAVKDIKKLSQPVPISHRDIIKTYRNYLKQSGVHTDDNNWERILEFVEVRNCIAHASGNVLHLNEKQQNRIKQLTSRCVGIEISGLDNRSRNVPLYLEEGMLIIQHNYIKEVILDFRLLLNALCDAIPLYKIRFAALDIEREKQN